MIGDNIWEPLTINSILDEVEHVLKRPLTSLVLQRNSYINRVFELEYADTRERLIVKFYRPGRWTRQTIKSEHNFLHSLATSELPVIPPLTISEETLWHLNGIDFGLFPKKGGRAIDEFDKDQWQQIGRLLGRMHSISKSYPNGQRLVWRPDVATRQHLSLLSETGSIPPDYQNVFPNIVEQLIAKTAPFFDKVEMFLIHGDCHKGNIIHRPGEGLFLIDFDDMAVGPAVQDLWMLLPGEVEHSGQELGWFLDGYETFADFPDASLPLVPALRAMRLVHYMAWLAVQQNDPGFSDNFPDWGAPRYWNEMTRSLQDILYAI